jgi:hypothetical protein
METEGKTEEGQALLYPAGSYPGVQLPQVLPGGTLDCGVFRGLIYMCIFMPAMSPWQKKMGSIFQIEFLQIIHLGSGPTGSRLDVSIQVSAAVGCK